MTTSDHEITISDLPGRKHPYLCLVSGGVITPLARFLSQKKADFAARAGMQVSERKLRRAAEWLEEVSDADQPAD